MFPLLAFLAPLAVRVVPEILMGPYIVGFDPVGYYIPYVLTWLRDGVDWFFIAEAPLFYVILMQLASLGAPLTLSLKIIPPILHGFLALAIYFYASKALAWSYRKSLFVALLATLYFVALRISWDLLRNEFGLTLLFITMIKLQKDDGRWKHYVLLSLAMAFVVLVHPLVAVIMFVVIATTIIRMLHENRYSDIKRLIMTSVPALLLFLLIVYANYVISEGRFSALSHFPAKKSEGPLALFGFDSYQDMVVDTLGFLFFCYLPLLLPAVMGAGQVKNLQINSWFIWSLIAIISPIISPDAFIRGGYRWTLMLTYPLAFYAIGGVARFKFGVRQLIIALVLIVLTFGFVLMPYERSFPYYSLFPYYVPSSMLQNTVPLRDCQDTINVLQYFKSNMHVDARLLTHTSFYGWALLVLEKDQIIHYGFQDPEKAAQKAIHGNNQVYLIWWTDGNGWYGQPSVPDSFKEVYKSGEIAIYAYRA